MEAKSIKEEPEQLNLVPEADDFAFDEMNLVEIPFCLSQRSNQGRTQVLLSPGGKEYIFSESPHGLPTALAEPTVLGLMWLTMERNGFKNSIIRFTLRELIERYMYGERYKKFRASGKLVKAVEDEINRVADTRLHSERWYDKKLGKHVKINAAIIDYFEVIDEGSNRKPRLVEIKWGEKFFQSIQSRYTKKLDAEFYKLIQYPVDRKLYRWLDRQMYNKDSLVVKSCQNFGRYKMMIQGRMVGGRTESNYILKILKDAMTRLKGLGFAVKMTVDKSLPDFVLKFEKIPGTEHEVVELDSASELVREFYFQFHGYDRQKKRRLRESDVTFAQKWIEGYGLKQAKWMVKRCKELHSQGRRAGEPVYSFVGVEIYEIAAAASYENYQEEKAGQLKFALTENREKKWNVYQKKMIAKADAELSPEMQNEYLEEAKRRAREQLPENIRKMNGDTFIGPMMNLELIQLKLEHAGAMTKEEFMSYEKDEWLHTALRERHGVNFQVIQ